MAATTVYAALAMPEGAQSFFTAIALSEVEEVRWTGPA